MRAHLLFAVLLGCGARAPAIDAFSAAPADARVDAAAPPGRATEDLPDDAPGAYQIHVLYVVPAERTPSAPLDTDGSIRRSVAAFGAWFAHQTGGPRLRFDTADGVLDVTYVQLAPPYTERALAEGTVGAPGGPDYLRDRLEALLAPRFADPHKMYLVYWDGLAFRHCGGAPLPPLLHGHMPSLQVGGLFASSFLTAAAAVGATELAVHPLAALPFDAPPFDATLGGEAVRVIALGDDRLTLAAPLAAAHPAGEPLQAATTIPDCRANPFSPDGHTLGYWEFSGAHEILHALGIAPPEAADYAPPPVAPGHLAATGPDGTADLMYQGAANWGCLEFPPAPTAAASACRLDSGHRNYRAVTGRAVSVDLAASVFLDPTPPGAVAPPGW